MKRWMQYIVLIILTFAAMTSFAQMSHQHEMNSIVVKAIAVVFPTKGNTASGTVTFEVVEDGMRVVADIEGLTPGKHGFHVHEYGDCSSSDAMSAGGHFNPMAKPHSSPMDSIRHVGDLGNLVADAQGRAHIDRVDPMLSFFGASSIIGRSVVVHEKEDDLKSQPTGAAGARVGCGVIGIAKK
jgi:superoxide dismutase, Cu-Zn family